MSDLSHIFNFVQLTPAHGTAGQPTAEQLADIAAAGYRLVINLALPTSDNAIANEGALVTGLGMGYFHLPVDFAAPTEAELDVFMDVLDAHQEVPVFIHCVMNLRVSAFMYRYLTGRRGFSPTDARSSVMEKWLPKMDSVWREFVERGES